MSDAGSALMGVGEAQGENKSRKAVLSAIDSPLVEVNIEGAHGVLINITGGPDLTMAEIEESAKTITEHTSPDANIIFGATIDPSLKDKIKISVIATGFDGNHSSIYKPYKKPVQTVTDPKKDATTLTDNEVKKLMGDQEIPAGVDIIDEFDIPAFLRKK
jgi:cell division protein FtsZ